jgi:hypothetical protein
MGGYLHNKMITQKPPVKRCLLLVLSLILIGCGQPDGIGAQIGVNRILREKLELGQLTRLATYDEYAFFPDQDFVPPICIYASKRVVYGTNLDADAALLITTEALLQNGWVVIDTEFATDMIRGKYEFARVEVTDPSQVKWNYQPLRDDLTRFLKQYRNLIEISFSYVSPNRDDC